MTPVVTAVQTLVLENFPRPEIARALSPNGRAHWAVKRKARLNVVDHVTVAAIKSGLRLMQAPVLIRLKYVMPDHKLRDQDNYSGGGVTKAVIDTLVNGQWLEGDDSARLQIAPVELVTEKGRRALEITLENLPPGAPA